MVTEVPTYHPLSVLKEFDTGANAPLLCRSVDEKGHKEDIVIKCMAAERMNPSSAGKELIGALIADAMGLRTAKPVLVDVSPEFVQSQIGKPWWQKLDQSMGLNYGSVNIPGLAMVHRDFKCPDDLKNLALRILYFDLIIENNDRTNRADMGKPNLFQVDNKSLIVLDHELAFAFCEPLIGFSPPAYDQLSSIDESLIRQHVLYKSCNNREVDYTALNAIFDDINDEFWKKANALIPPEWAIPTGLIEKVKEHIDNRKTHNEALIVQLKKILL